MTTELDKIKARLARCADLCVNAKASTQNEYRLLIYKLRKLLEAK